MVNLIRCDGGPTNRAAASAAEVRPVSCHITQNLGPPHRTALAQIYWDLRFKTVVRLFSDVELQKHPVCVWLPQLS